MYLFPEEVDQSNPQFVCIRNVSTHIHAQVIRVLVRYQIFSFDFLPSFANITM